MRVEALEQHHRAKAYFRHVDGQAALHDSAPNGRDGWIPDIRRKAFKRRGGAETGHSGEAIKCRLTPAGPGRPSPDEYGSAVFDQGALGGAVR
jgi:hypothetical protein